MHLYNVPEHGEIADAYHLDEAWLKVWHKQAREWRNEFFKCYPDLNETCDSTIEEERNVCNPDGSVDLWQALFAANAYRFSLLDQFEYQQEICEEQQEEQQEELHQKQQEQQARIALFVHIFRLRESATVQVALAAEQLLRAMHANKPSSSYRLPYPSYTRLANYMSGSNNKELLNPKHATSQDPLMTILHVTRVLLTSFMTLRNAIRNQSFFQFFKFSQHLHAYVSLRNASLLTLLAYESSFCTEIQDAWKNFYNSVHGLEQLLMEQFFLLSAILERIGEEDEQGAAAQVKRLVLKLGLSMHTEDDEKLLYKGLSIEWKHKVLEYVQEFPAVLYKCSAAPVTLMHYLALAAEQLPDKHRNDLVLQISYFLVNDLLSSWKIVFKSVEPAFFEQCNFTWNEKLNFDNNLEHMHKCIEEVSENRAQWMLQEESCSTTRSGKKKQDDDVLEERFHYHPATFAALVQRAKRLGVS